MESEKGGRKSSSKQQKTPVCIIVNLVVMGMKEARVEHKDKPEQKKTGIACVKRFIYCFDL